jgi:hypothetical protein
MQKYVFLTVATFAVAACNQQAMSTQKAPTKALHADKESKEMTEKPTQAETPYAIFSKAICDKLSKADIAKSVDIGDFVPGYPNALVDPETVENQILTAGEIDDLVKGLACGAGLSGFGPDVPETALSLFASKAHGQKALASLAKLRHEKTVMGMAAKDFYDQMGDYLKEPTE